MTTLTESSAAELFRQAPDRMLDVGFAEAAYRRVGSGPDVLFVHGWRGSPTSSRAAPSSICSSWTTLPWSATTVAA